MIIRRDESSGAIEVGPRAVETVNHLDPRGKHDMAWDIIEGLKSSPKRIPCKYFYDAHGSKIFERICRLPEYYPTRTELSILQGAALELMETCAHKDLVELGSGASLKIKTLLDTAGESRRATLRYVAVDISEAAVVEAANDLEECYPELEVLGIVADFTCQMDVLPSERPMMFCFLGSTIGNMERRESVSFLRDIAGNMGDDDALLVGFDMVKPREVLEAAYNDSQGVTAEFNKNVLSVVNERLGGDFDPSDFDHVAFYNEAESRIEMHLRANRSVRAWLQGIGMEIAVEEGETIHTENSRKFTCEGISDMARDAGLSIRKWYTDPEGWFSLVVMTLDGAGDVNDSSKPPIEAVSGQCPR
jgi:L-histidine N-alpha-methyltransferase